MEVISIDGTEYVKASALARQFKYTSDYIGQLCRAGKVDSKLVGRTWYVSQSSLEAHKTGRYVKDGPDEKMSDSRSIRVESRKDVEAVVRRDTVRNITDPQVHAPKFLKRIEWKPVKYEVDESELLPPLREVRAPKSVPVEFADSVNIPIQGSDAYGKLVAESLPEVALTGSLSVKEIDDAFEFDENIPKNIDISDEEESVTVKVKANKSDAHRKVTIHEEEPVKVAKAASRPELEDKFTYDVPVMVKESIDFAPQSTRIPALAVSAPDVPKRSMFRVLVVWGLLVLCAVLGAAAVSFVEFDVTVSKTSFSNGLHLNTQWPF